MKKIILPLFAAIMLCSCGNTTSKSAGECDSDSVASFEETEECEANLNYMHPDTQMFELFGMVKSMTLTKYYDVSSEGEIKDKSNSFVEKKLFFTRSGEFDIYNKDFEWRLTNPQFDRSSELKVSKVTWHVEDFDMNLSDTYEYNSHGMVSKLESEGVENFSTITFKYDNNTNLISSHDESVGEGSIFCTDITYTILEKDAQGNWTKRLLKCDEKTGDDDGSGKYTESSTYYEVETREIEYYE